MSHIQTTVSFDMRSPAFGAPTKDLYANALEMAAFADEIGVDRIGLMEHHASDDGYLPAPFVLGGGVAARTRNCMITLGAVILPLHDPVKIAEQIAVLDLMSNGRLKVIFGAGYVPSEFAMFQVSLRDRAKLLDQGIDIILRALHGERFEADGRPVLSAAAGPAAGRDYHGRRRGRGFGQARGAFRLRFRADEGRTHPDL